MKTAYHVAREWVRPSAQHGSSSSSPNPFSELWSKVWHANVPPKVRVSFWRLCTESLLTRKNLGLKHITTDLLCVLCNSPTESVSHLIRDCQYARCAWLFSPLGPYQSSRIHRPSKLGCWTFFITYPFKYVGSLHDDLLGCLELSQQQALE